MRANELAPPRQWLERAAYTLTGLPPSREQIERLAGSPDEATYLAIVDELLASPAYGQRWARHWMDVARYADTMGYNFDRDNRYPFAYTYRDWLVKAFNEDLPYDRFIEWQLAGDLIAEDPADPNLAALGFLTVGQRSGREEVIDDRVDVVTRGFLGSTVSCARCHEHKTDPITEEDYYSLFSIFENLDVPEEGPVIGKPTDEAAHQDFLTKVAEVESRDLAAREELRSQLHNPESSAVYLELAWLALQENWDHDRATGEAFKRGRFRPGPVIRWRDFLKEKIDQGVERLRVWNAAMEDEGSRKRLCRELADQFAGAGEDSELGRLKNEDGCPLAFDVNRVREFFDTEDHRIAAERNAEISRLRTEHPGSPPRAMVVHDRENWAPAQVYNRGNPSDRGEPFERHWLSFLGGGTFDEGQSPRLSLAGKIADPANPLTARVIANRVWGWHFDNSLTEPSDYGYEQAEPAQSALLDHLANYLLENGWSLKALHRHILASRAFRLSADFTRAGKKDEANTLFWQWRPQRLDFESMRDRIIASSGALDLSRRGGPAGRLEDPAMDSRRTIEAFVDRYDLDSSFVAFDLPHPDLHASRRVETTVPQQSLYLLNGKSITREASRLAANPELNALPDNAAKVRWIYQRVFQREPFVEESAIALEWLDAVDPADYLPPVSGFWEVRHALASGESEEPFPILQDGVWKTGADLANAPLRWLSAARDHGHPLRGHAVVIRWRTFGPGEVRLTGKLNRPGDKGDVLAWEVHGPGGVLLTSGKLAPTGQEEFDTGLIAMPAGEGLSFHFLAPDGENTGHTRWSFAISGRENAESAEKDISDFSRDFPTSTTPPPPPGAGDPLADLIQMIWASNEFNYID